MLASLRALSGWRDLKLRISFDGAPSEELEVTTLAVTNDTNGAVGGMPLTTTTSLSINAGYLDYGHADQLATNLAGPHTQGTYSKVALSFGGQGNNGGMNKNGMSK